MYTWYAVPLALTTRAGRHGVRAAGAHQLDAVPGQCSLDPGVAAAAVRPEVVCHVDRAGTGRECNGHDFLDGVTRAQLPAADPAAEVREAGSEVRPPRGTGRSPQGGVEDEQWYDTLAAGVDGGS